MEAPEVSASSGVVPTPKIVVEQIVKDTLNPLMEGLTFRALCDLKLADICCGSGTFLISAYDFLLEKMMERIIEEKIEDSALVCYIEGKGLTFTLKAKRNILEGNLFGVDINPYAVEVTEFSLLLKLLEGEDEASVNNFIHQHSGKILPNLKKNIKCGNSLVDSKFFEFMPQAMYDDRLLFTIKPFDWENEYSAVMRNGGFDAIIGNPPYVRIQNMQKYNPEEIKYYQSSNSQYVVAKKATIDKYFVFIQRAIELLNKSGLLGYIVPHKFFLTKGGEELRRFITGHYQISKITHFGSTQVFPQRTTYTAILIIQKSKKLNFEFKKINRVSVEQLSSKEHILSYETDRCSSEPWVFLSPATEKIFNKFKGEKFERLGDITDINVGLQTSADKIYIFTPETETEYTFVFNKGDEKYEVEKNICRETIYDLSFNAFESIKGNAQMIFPYEIKEGEAYLIEEAKLEEGYPLTWKYLNKFKPVLEKRSLQGNFPKWYQFGRSQSLAKFHNTKKLIWSVLATKPPYVLDINNLLFTGGGNGPYYGLLNKSNYSLFYFLGILAHPLIENMVKAGASEFRGAYYSHGKQFIENLPIRKINPEKPEEVKMYNLVVDNVENLIVTIEQLKNERNGSRKEVLTRKIDFCNQKLIEIINCLYDVSDEEYRTVVSDEMLNIQLGDNDGAV
jgi:type I restriction-modification system DNA methylase subunit